ncbi:MAG TPA: TolC family protein [Vicinamibacterales bacterium]|jgi:outer membrane protein TolC|nr:TolC family protein [Vicinamibacterales bacterium]
MTRNVTKQLMTAALAAVSLAVAVPARAQQTSEDRIQELVRQAAARFATRTPAASAQAPQAPAAPGQVLNVTLDDAVKMALDRNLDIAVQRLNPQINDVAVASALTVFKPIISSNLSQRSSENEPTSTLTQGANGAPVIATSTYNGGYSQNINFHGGLFTASLNNFRQTSTSNTATFTPEYSSTWTLNYTQPLFRNWRIDANRETIAIARVNRDISDVQLQSTITNTVSNVRNAYWDYVYAQGAVDVAQQSLDIANRLVTDDNTRVEVGTMAPLDVKTAQSQAANALQSLVAAQSTKQTAELALKKLVVGSTDDAAWKGSLHATDTPDFAPQPVDIEGAIRRALSQRTDLAIVKKTVSENDVILKYLKDQTRAQFDFVAAYGTNGVAGTQITRSGVTGGASGTTDIPYFQSFSTLFKSTYPTWSFGINFSYPLGLSAQEASVAKARITLNQIDAQQRQIELQVANDVTSAAITVQNSAEAVRAAQTSVDLAQQELDAEQSKFDVGMSTNYNIVLAQTNFSTARGNQLSALRNYRKALVELERQQQTTLTSAGITILGR